MGNRKTSSISNIIIIITIIIFVIIILGIVFYFFNQFKKIGEENKNAQQIASSDSNNYDYNSVPEGMINNVGNNISTLTPAVKFSSAKQQVRCYSIKLVKEKGREREYQLDNIYKTKMKISDKDSNKLELTINNNSKVIEDGLCFSDFKDDSELSFTYNFYRVGDYLTFTNHDATDLRSTHLYVADKNGDVEDIYELDSSNKGMVIESIDFIDNKIIMQTTRKTDGGTIIYNGKNASDQSVANSIPKNTAVDATYTYTIDSNGNISFNNPEIKVRTTYQDILNKNSNTSNTKK